MARDDLDRDDLDQKLARVRAATEGIAPDDALAASVMAGVKDARPAGDPLAAIARATDSLDAGGAFTDAVMALVSRASARRPAPSWLDGVTRSGPIAVGLAAALAAASVAFFLSSQGDLDETVVSSVDALEVIE